MLETSTEAMSSDEARLLLGQSSETHDNFGNFDDATSPKSDSLRILFVLPIALFAGLGMAATAASSVFSYATIICKDPVHCLESEKNRYAGSVALASTISSACGVLVLG